MNRFLKYSAQKLLLATIVSSIASILSTGLVTAQQSTEDLFEKCGFGFSNACVQGRILPSIDDPLPLQMKYDLILNWIGARSTTQKDLEDGAMFFKYDETTEGYTYQNAESRNLSWYFQNYPAALKIFPGLEKAATLVIIRNEQDAIEGMDGAPRLSGYATYSRAGSTGFDDLFPIAIHVVYELMRQSAEGSLPFGPDAYMPTGDIEGNGFQGTVRGGGSSWSYRGQGVMISVMADFSFSCSHNSPGEGDDLAMNEWLQNGYGLEISYEVIDVNPNSYGSFSRPILIPPSDKLASGTFCLHTEFIEPETSEQPELDGMSEAERIKQSLEDQFNLDGFQEWADDVLSE